MTLSAKGLTSTDLASVLSDQIGTRINFVPATPGELYDIDVSSMPAAELRQVLAEFGAIVVAVDKPEIEHRKALMLKLPDSQVTLRMENTTASQVVSILSQLLGGADVSLVADDPDEVLSLDVTDTDLQSLIQGLQATSSIRMVQAKNK